MRGKGRFLPGDALRVGITPAYAGKRKLPLGVTWHTGDHPRVCGEKWFWLSTMSRVAGSPPRMRGKGWRSSLCKPLRGITPAYAGKRTQLDHRGSGIWDHPRVCGEKRYCRYADFHHRGSPPRMRGKETKPPWNPVSRGITPAYAGKRSYQAQVFYIPKDHPRVCGEKPFYTSPESQLQGSPPRMRGKEALVSLIFTSTRITPAYAGKSVNSFLSGASSGDHPRVCGEKSGEQEEVYIPTGSPPRMRGKAYLKVFCLKLMRITPAYAGKRTQSAP